MNPIVDRGNQRKRSWELQTSDHAPHAYHGNMITPPASYQWHEIEYTTPIVDVNNAAHFAPTSAPNQYVGGVTTQFSPVNYTQQGFAFASAYSDNDNGSAFAQASMYRVGPFRYADIDTASLSQESIYSRGTRMHSLTDSERRDSQPNSVMTGSDTRRESESLMRDFPMMNHESENCQGEVCGPTPPCLDLANLSSIEECMSAPHLTSVSSFAASIHSASPTVAQDRDSEDRIVSPSLHSPTALEFQEPTATESSKNIRSRRNVRAKTVRSASSDDLALDKASKLRARQAHSLVERKYRDNLNLKISQLHQTLQNARYGPAASQSPITDHKLEYLDHEMKLGLDSPSRDKSSAAAAPKARKSDVLTEAMSYVNATEVEMRHMSEEIIRLTDRVQMLEKLIRCEDCNLMKQMVTLQVQGAGQQDLHAHPHMHQCR